jgi:glycosyltransferase involved in cell wall biosynthesis
MRIAYLNTLGIPARYGGFETCVEEVSTRLARRGHEVTVYCGSPSLTPKYSSYKGVKLVNLPRNSNKFLDFPSRSLVSTLDAMAKDLDVLHYYGTDSWIFALLSRFLSGKVVMSLDGLTWKRTSYPRWIRAALRLSSWLPLYVPHATTVDSSYVKEWYMKNYGRVPIYIPYGAKVSPRGANAEALRSFGVEEDRYIIFVGRLVPEKGVHHLVGAFNELGMQSFQLIVVGGNPYRSSYELQLRRTARNGVRFLGYVYGANVENLLRGAYLYVTASELEGTSPALLSAMGFGNCVLASDIPENVETVGDAGVTFRNGDRVDLREKLRYLLSNPSIVRDYRKRAVERVARLYSWDTVADRMERLYFSLTRRTRA